VVEEVEEAEDWTRRMLSSSYSYEIVAPQLLLSKNVHPEESSI
jgi:pyrroloquinoline quinone (PQQ) biosynthesis protein C